MTVSPNIELKAMAILILYIVLGHPSVYLTFWERRDWYILILAALTGPAVLFWCAQVLIWRVKIDSSTIRILSLQGLLKESLRDVVHLDRIPGRVVIAFRDGSHRSIPSIVGNLDAIAAEITSRRRELQTGGLSSES